jgi:hypothetical protein
MKRTIIVSCCLCLLLLPASVLPDSKILTPNGTTLHSTSSGTLAPDYDAKIETKYDGFNNETIVTLKKMGITCGGGKGMESALKQTCVSFVLSLHCPGVQLDYVRYAKLQLIFETKDWDQRHPLDERDLLVVADGEKLKLGKMMLAEQGATTSQLVDVMREVLEVVLPYQTFQKIAKAKTVEMRVGKTMFELQDKNVVALRNLNNRVKF